MIKVKFKHIIDPIFLVPFLYVSQFLLYLIIFERFKYDVYLLENVPTFLNLESIIKIISLFLTFYVGIILGRSYKVKLNIDDFFFYKISSRIIFLFFLIFLVVEIFIVLRLRNAGIDLENIQSFATLSYITIQNEEAWYKTILNIGLFIGSFYIYFSIKNRKKIILICLFIFIFITYLVNALFFSQRQIFIVLIGILSLIYFRINDFHKKHISLHKIILAIVILFAFVIFAEMFRYGLFNSLRKNINLFSIENITDVLKYLLTAYLAKDVNNALIALASEPTYNFFSTGSKLLYKIILIFKEEQPFNPIVDPGPHGTVNFLALLWVDWGYVAFFLLPLLGFMIGFSYNLYLKGRNFISIFFYSLIFTGILSNIRINFFFLNIYIYNFALVIFFTSLYIILNTIFSKKR